MAEINEAWRVLSDPGRRAVYDATLRRPAAGSSSWTAGPEDLYRVPSGAFDDRGPARFPLWPIFILVVLGAIFIFTAGALNDDDTPRPTIDGLLRPGECVVIETNGDAAEVACDQPHDGKVGQFVSLSTACPLESREHRDKQGMGKVCVVPG